MFRLLKSMSVTVMCSIAAVVAVPSSPVAAETKPRVYVTVNGEESAKGWEAIRTGTSFTVEAEVTSELPVTYAWEPEVDPSVGSVVGGLTSPVLKMQCDSEGIMDIDVTVTDSSGAEGFGNMGIYCQTPPFVDVFTSEYGPVEGRRELVALGTSITFDAREALPPYKYEWRTTGVDGVDGEEPRYVRTFDRVGLFGVEVTALNDVGMDKEWLGYKVLGTPIASVRPAPANQGQPLQVNLGSKVTFSGAGSRSPGGGTLTYEWRDSGVDGVAGDKTSYARRFDQAGEFTVELTVADQLGQNAKQTVAVQVVKLEPPVVSVTPAPQNEKERMRVTLGDTVTFNGTASVDPDGGELTYNWRTTGVRGIAWTGSTYQRKFDRLGNFGVELTVIDDEGQRAKRWVGVTVVR